MRALRGMGRPSRLAGMRVHCPELSYRQPW